jgi:hypothetical protein
MTGFNLFSVGAAGVIAFSLHGCGGGGGGGGDTTPAPDPDTVSSTTAAVTTTTTTDVCANAVVVPTGEDELVDWLNSLYTGFKEDDPTSPNGVTIRVADDFSMYCGTPCFQGNPDCRISASLYNSKMLVMHDTFKPAVTMGRDAGIVFNQTTIEASSGKCAFMYDGATFGRVNRGCGCPARQAQSCGQEGPYWNQDCQYEDMENHRNIDPSTCHDNTDTSPDVEQCWCNTDHLRVGTPKPEDAKTTDLQCFFKGGGLYPPQPQQPEWREFVKARLANQEANGGTEIVAGTGETRYKSEYWNEVVVDAEVLIDILRNENVSNTNAVSAFMYVEEGAGNGSPGKQKALNMQLQAYRDYGTIIPIVAFDKSVDLRCSGPFRKATDLGPPPERCAGAWDQCGTDANICCQDGLECVVNNPYYSNCQPIQSQDGDFELVA